ncbi:hypothetical protein HKD37_07G020206 [Glycine soja]
MHAREGESGRASASRSRAKHEISALSTSGIFSQAQRTIGAKLEFTYPAKREGGAKRNIANSELI